MNASGQQPAPAPQKPVVFAPADAKAAPKKQATAPHDVTHEDHDEPGYGHGV
jgi:hypothetical protein